MSKNANRNGSRQPVIARTLVPLRSLFRTLHRDQRGNLGVMGVLMMTTIVAMGTIVGLSTWRDHVLQQFGDAAVALRNLRQTYSYEVEVDGNGNGVFTDPEDCVFRGSFTDAVDLFDAAGDAPACMQLAEAPTNES